MSTTKLSVAAFAVVAMAFPAAARHGSDDDDFCTSAPRSTWIAMSVVTAKAQTMGYSVWKSEISGTCYEIYGRKNGQSYELYFNPATGDLVKIESD